MEPYVGRGIAKVRKCPFSIAPAGCPLAGALRGGTIPRMARPRLKIKRDFKTPLKGLGSVVLMALFFVFFCEALMGALRFLVG